MQAVRAVEVLGVVTGLSAVLGRGVMAMCHSFCSYVMVELHTRGYIFLRTHVNVVEVVEHLGRLGWLSWF